MMTRSTISPSPISISLTTLLFITFAFATSLHETENCGPKLSHGFTIPSHVEKQGQDAIKEYLDSVFSHAVFGGVSSETLQNKETYPDTYASEDVEGNMDADKSASKLVKGLGEDGKVIIPSHVEDQGPDAIKEYLDELLMNALFGSDSAETGPNQDPLSDSNSVELDSKTQIKHEGEKNMDSYKSAKKVSKLAREEQLLDDDIEVKVEFEIMGDGEYVLKMKRVNPSLNNEDEVERAKNLAQNGAMLYHYGEILQDMGDKLISQSRTLLYSLFKMPATPTTKSDD